MNALKLLKGKAEKNGKEWEMTEAQKGKAQRLSKYVSQEIYVQLDKAEEDEERANAEKVEAKRKKYSQWKAQQVHAKRQAQAKQQKAQEEEATKKQKESDVGDFGFYI